MTAFNSVNRAVALFSAIMLSAVAAIPSASATQPLRDVALNGDTLTSQTSLQNQTIAQEDETSIPDNPTQELPDKVASAIPDDATLVSPDIAVTKTGALKDVETGRTVTDPQLVGTKDQAPDPLAKTDGESFIPVSVGDVREQIEQNDASAQTADTETKATVRQASIGDNQYGAHWGTYGGQTAFFEADGTVFARNAKAVIDVSEWQHTIDWQAAKNAGVQGAIIRIGYGTSSGDLEARRNIQEVKRLGIPFGVYLYSYAYDAEFAAEEGAHTVELLKEYGISPSDLKYPVYYDLERWTWTGYTPPTDPETYEDIVDAWYAQLQNAGYKNLSVYSYTSYLDGPLNSPAIRARTHWVASYGARTGFNDWSTKVRGWQYTSSGQVAGIEGNVDLNAFGTTDGSSVTGGSDVFDVGNITMLDVPDGEYYLTPTLKTSSSVEIANGSSANGATPVLHSYNNSRGQRFRFIHHKSGGFVIVNVSSGKALEVAGGVGKGGAVIQQNTRNDSNAQRWVLREAGDGYYIQTVLGNFVMEVVNKSTADGTPIRLGDPNGGKAQTFLLPASDVAAPSGTLNIVSALDSTKVVGVANNSTKFGARLQLQTSTGDLSQQFRFSQVGNGMYRIRNVRSGAYVGVANGSYLNGSAIQLQDKKDTLSQYWQLRKGDGGKILLISSANKAIDIPGGTSASGTGLQIYSENDSQAQQWSLTAAKESTASKVDVYRMYNTVNGDHIITSDINEVWGLSDGDWINEGVAMRTEKKGANGAKPVYRLYNVALNDHVFTDNANEYAHLKKVGWNDEGVAFYAPSSGGVTVHRIYHKGARMHLFTSDENEYRTLKEWGWSDEGVAFKALEA